MNIDINKMRIPTNRVMIQLDPEFEVYHNTETGQSTGIHVAPWGINAAGHLAVTGTVVGLPERLVYHGDLLKRLKADKLRTPADQQYIADMRRESMAYDVPLEVGIGQKVYFEYTTRLDAMREGRYIENDLGKFLLLPYDMLVMAFRPGTNLDDVQVNDVYMLNGHVLIKPLEYATEKDAAGIQGYKTENDLFVPVAPTARFVKKNNLWYGTILAVGCRVKSYVDFPDRPGDSDLNVGKPGQKIMYDGRQQKRLEHKHHRVIFKKYELYRVHRKDIHAVFLGDKII